MWCNIISLQTAAVQWYYNADSPAQIQIDTRTHTRTHTYPRGVHDCDRCAATLRWAFQHFWSGQQPAHSFPPSQYLHKHIFQKQIFYINYAWLTAVLRWDKGGLERARSKILWWTQNTKKWTIMLHRESLGQHFTFDWSYRHVKGGYSANYTTAWHHNVAPVTITMYYLLSATKKSLKWLIVGGQVCMYNTDISV